MTGTERPDRPDRTEEPGLADNDWLATAGSVAVHGLGREGRSVIADLAVHNPQAHVVVLDDREPSAAEVVDLTDRGIEVVVGPDAAAGVTPTVDLVVRSAGVPLSHPAQVAARTAGVPVTTVLNVFLARHRPDNLLAVTGTKGKSTTATLLAHQLSAAGRRVQVAGNVGLSVLDLDVAPTDLDHLVVELSSYQLADLRGRVAVGAWLNLHADHHAWHGGAGAYARDKARMTELADVVVANAADEQVMTAVRSHPRVVTFDASRDPVVAGEQDVPADRLEHVLDQSRMVGHHNVANIAAATTMAGLVGVGLDQALAAVVDFEPLPHRLQVVHEARGIRWVDDSISTIPETAVAALAAFPDVAVTLLAGGFDRGQDHAPLVAAITARSDGPAPVTVVAMPDTGARLATDLEAQQVAVTQVDGLAEAVAHAAAVTPGGGVVLLSPAAASFTHFTSYVQRGQRFAALARSAFPVPERP